MNKKNKGYINNIIASLTKLSEELKDKDKAYILSNDDHIEEIYNENIAYLEEILYAEEDELENMPNGAKSAQEAKIVFKNVNILDGAIDRLDGLVDALDKAYDGNETIDRINKVIERLKEI